MSKVQMKFTIEGGFIKTKNENIHQHLQEVNRGAGRHKTKKGKGSYTRKSKHRESYF